MSSRSKRDMLTGFILAEQQKYIRYMCKDCKFFDKLTNECLKKRDRRKCAKTGLKNKD